MHRNCWAVFWHKLSNDDKHYHDLFTANCPYKKAVAAGTENTYKHKSSLPEAIMDEIKPIFRDLTHPSLLKKCLEGYTQNQNESVNNLIWRYCPKVKNHGLVTVNAGVSLAVSVFNDGACTYIRVLEELGVEAGQFAKNCMFTIDEKRTRHAKRQALQATHQARIKTRQDQKDRNEEAVQRDGVQYLGGNF